jgi:uncharacterized membrane protein YwaF
MSFFIDWTWGDINAGDVGPGMFSWFHILSLVIMIIACIILCMTIAKKHNPKYDRIIVSIFSIILLICEVFKQLFWYEFYGYYRFEIFPYQFCTVPIYVSIVASIIPSDKVREVCYRFLAFYGIIGGIAVMLVPTAVLYTYFVAMSLHSMIWHSILVIMGAYLIVSRNYGNKIKELFVPSLMLLGFVTIALIGNILVYKLHLGTENCQPGDNLSMFYISPYYDTQLPLLGMIQKFSYPLFFLSYLLIFNSFSLLVWYISNLCRKFYKKKQQN